MSAGSLLIHDISYLVTLDQERQVLQDAWVWIDSGVIRSLGQGDLPDEVPAGIESINGAGRIVIPGLVNTHHHFYQNMARAYTPGNNLSLLPWLGRVNKLWKNFREEDLALCTKLGLAELMLSGATTVADHHYIFPKGSLEMIDTQFAAAAEMGIRFHASRGSMNVKSEWIADWALEDEDEILCDTERLIQSHHDSDHGSWSQIIVAPCAATSCSESLLKASAELAIKYGVGLHTHCGETADENAFSLEKFGRRPVEYLLDCGWGYDRTWFAHGIHFDDTELQVLEDLAIGVAHCPNANMRLGSGICRVPEMTKRGIKVGIGVGGSASNDSGHILAELRQALYLSRVRYGAEAMSVMDAFELGTWRAAELMGRSDIGRIQEGYCGDLAVFPVNDLYANGYQNPVDALLLCHPRQVTDLVVGGNARVRDGAVVGLDLPGLMHTHQRRAEQMHSSVS